MGPKAKPAKEGDHQQEEERVDTTSTRPTEGEGPSGSGSPAEGVVSELASMMKTMLQAQEVRESRWEKVVQSQDQRWKVMSHQFQLLQGQVGDIQGKAQAQAGGAQPEGNLMGVMRSVVSLMVKHCNAVTRAQRASELRALPFAEDELVLDVESRGERKHLSRQEKRRQKITVEAGQEKREWTQPSMALEMDIPTNIVELQRQDKTLELWFQKATGGVKGTQSTSSCMQEERVSANLR
ncbi:unnamed protein product [Arctogadus glacialis]